MDKKEELGNFLNRYPHETSGLTFTSLYMWRKSNQFTYEIIDDFLCVAARSNFEGFEEEPFVFPLLPLNGECDAAKMKDAMGVIFDRFRELGKPYVMRLIPSHMIKHYQELMPGKFLFLEDRANHDYVYKVDDLANLSGRRFHGKKNHVNKFNKELEGRYEVIPMSADLADEAIELLTYIDGKKDVEGFEASMLGEEAMILKDTLPHFDELGMEGAAIRIDGKLEAYAFGGPLGDNTIVEHIEKGNIDYPGIYQKINQEFCKAVQGKYEFVNREEDMGLEGLRKAKTSYKPCRMIEKSIAMLADDKEAIARYSDLG
ncbi:MAG: phosphatidylglycerol lysyltransferase domain-containing protein [Anaerovoracaceae bacterium]|nr:phosphatidylglycerol lysyltransferase domain-containing protein [Bacillota bacterium]MDY2670780.1 phosphatidylglycerol lysyltransferase domain-containing protein [Anaerovoracaceae bacterium]